MNRRFRYVFAQMLAPFATACLILMTLLYFVNIPRVLDALLVQGGAPSGTMNLLLLLLLFILPKILAYILPVSLLAACLYVLYRLHADNERIALEASGASYWTIAAPMLSFAALVMLAVFSLHAYFMPMGERGFQSRVLEIHDTITAAVLRPGEFYSLGGGVTTFARSRDRDGALRDILVQDARDREQPVTYLAARGQLLQTPEGPRLEMFDGSIQRFERPNDPGSLNILSFSRYVYTLSDLAAESSYRALSRKERFLAQLLRPDEQDAYAQNRRADFLADGHNRLAVPLFCLVYALVALAAFRRAHARRGGYFALMLAAISLCLAVRLVYLGITGLAREEPLWLAFLYLVPVSAALASLFVVAVGRGGFAPFARMRLRSGATP